MPNAFFQKTDGMTCISKSYGTEGNIAQLGDGILKRIE